ncbi:MAG: hypothetical protein SYC29_13470 [Planctomycetota bacterium]|nr:hypothetical protein [Planctomycetota bacterium]
MRIPLLSLALAAVVALPAAGETLIDKQPDQGPFWHPLGNSSSDTRIYASDFLAPDGDTVVDALGTWLLAYAGGPPYSEINFQIWGTDPGTGGPDFDNVIAYTDTMQTDDPNLTLYTMDVIGGSATLTPGERYWFIANCYELGDPSYGSYQVGAHTQNSQYQDNGTFWYSNYPEDGYFDGQGLTPQMAFQVSLIPTPGVLALLGVAGLARRRRR